MQQLTFLSFYNLPGEGIVAEFDNGYESVLYDIQGLQYRIIENKKQGIDTSSDETILSQMKSLLPQGLAYFEEKHL